MNHYYRMTSIQSSYLRAETATTPQTAKRALALLTATLTSGALLLLLG